MIKTKLVRKIDLNDAERIREIYAFYVENAVISFESKAPTSEEIKVRIEQITAIYPWLVYELDGLILGYAYASQHRPREAYQWSVDVSVYVVSGHQKRGIGRILYESLLEELAQLGYANAFAGIVLPNEASVALHERMGFERIGIYRKVGFKRGSWHDIGWWQRSFAHPSTPDKPRQSI